MLGWPTIREGQEKSEEGNSPKHSEPSFRCSCLIRISTNNVYIVEISSVFADNVSAMVRFEWNSVFWIITKYIFWPPLCLVRKRMKEALKWFCLSRFRGKFIATLARCRSRVSFQKAQKPGYQVKKHRKNCESYATQVTWKVQFRCLSCLSRLHYDTWLPSVIWKCDIFSKWNPS